MKFMTPKEKIEFLLNTPSENSYEIEERMEGGVLETKKDRTAPRVDLMAYIRTRMAEEGITITEMAQVVGKMRQNLNNSLNGRIPLPLNTLEEILWILDKDNFRK